MALIPVAAIPIVGAAIAGVALILGLIFARKGPGQKIASTSIVDQLEPALKANLAGYLASDRSLTNQAAALQNFDTAWEGLKSSGECGNPALGEPGKRCIKDRQPGGKWDWFRMYRDQIANDPLAGRVQPATTAAGGAVIAGVSNETLLWIGAGVLAAAFLL